MKNKFLCAAVLIAGLTIVSFHTNSLYGQTTQNKMAMKDTMKYTCPHHPDVVSDKPGKCPKCGMEMVAMKGNMSKSSGMKKDKMMDKSGKMKKDGMMHDSKDMKHDKMMKDSAMMKKGNMQ
jgi:Heavy metal binding domain